MRIIYKLILGFLSTVVLIWVVGYLAVNSSRKVLVKNIAETSVMLSRKIMDGIDRNIYYRIERWLSYVDSHPGLIETLANSNSEFENMPDMKGYIKQIDRDWAAGRETPVIMDILNNKLSNELKRRIEFYNKGQSYNVFAEAFVSNRYGAIVASTGKSSGYLHDNEKWYQTGIKKKAFWVGEVKQNESFGAYACDIAINLRDDSGNFIGMLKVVLNVDDAVNIIRASEPANAYEYYAGNIPPHMKNETMHLKLLTHDGRLIYSTKEYKMFEDASSLLKSFRHPAGGRLDYVIKEGFEEGEGEELSAHAHSYGYRDYKGLGWILLVDHATEEIFAPVEKLGRTLLLISMAVTLLALLIGIRISRLIARPVEKLRDAASRIGSGDLDVRIEVESNDEIGQLARDFNQMSGNLKEITVSRDLLVKEIKDRKNAEDQLTKAYYALSATQDASLNIMEDLDRKNMELEKALQEVTTLSGLVPICANCKKIRTDDGYWQQVEIYIEEHSEARFSHGICSDCLEKHYQELRDEEI